MNILSHIIRYFKEVSLDTNLIIFLLWIVLSFILSPYAQAQILFEEVTNNAGLSHSAPSWGASWGNFNNDGWPDIWVGNHGEEPSFYVSNGDGTFYNAISLVVDYDNSADIHGAAWGDFDNDGDQDLIQTVGGGSGVGADSNLLFINSGGILQNKASDYGLTYSLGRGRSATWFDWNNDGYLDVFLSNASRSDGQAPSALFTQNINYFSNDNSLTGIDVGDGEHWIAQPTILTDQYIPVLAIHKAFSEYPARVYEYDSVPLLDIKNTLNFPHIPWYTVDIAIADFNNDLLNDFYLVNVAYPSAAIQTASSTVKGRITVSGAEKGMFFQAKGNVQFIIEPSYSFDSTDIYIGSEGFNPADNQFTLSYLDENVSLIMPHSPGIDFGVFIGYDPATTLWQVYVSKAVWVGASITANADVLISELSTFGFVSSDGERSDNLLIQTVEEFQDVTVGAGLNAASACTSIAAEDFDNDMDIDIYLVCRGTISNLPNILYENLGNGSFQAIPEAGGAEGSSIGRGDSVVTADYNRDGFMDLFVANGDGPPPFGNGPLQLFRNVGNSNHWLEIDLVGVISNSDGVGAAIMATANGTTQLRYQDNGVHRYSQNHQRIHFGLADNIIVDQLFIQWPSGIFQEINNIPADQIFQTIELDLSGSPTSGNEPLTINFSSNSQGFFQPVSYKWDFDNDGIIDSTIQNPSYNYANGGTYTVKLTVTNYDGLIYSSTRTDYISTCSNVRVTGTTLGYYSTVQSAYDAAVDGDTIQSRAIDFTENIDIAKDISITLKGGYDCNHTASAGKTELNGNMIISNGVVTISDFALK